MTASILLPPAGQLLEYSGAMPYLSEDSNACRCVRQYPFVAGLTARPETQCFLQVIYESALACLWHRLFPGDYARDVNLGQWLHDVLTTFAVPVLPEGAALLVLLF